MEDFDVWLSRLRHLAPDFGFYENEIEPDDWRDFYEDGLSPHDALVADLGQG